MGKCDAAGDARAQANAAPGCRKPGSTMVNLPPTPDLDRLRQAKVVRFQREELSDNFKLKSWGRPAAAAVMQ
jgi:hypothetical protein